MLWLRHLAALFFFLTSVVRQALVSAFTHARPRVGVGHFEVATNLLVGELDAAIHDGHQGIGACRENCFEWIIDQWAVRHRVFVGGGTINGVPTTP